MSPDHSRAASIPRAPPLPEPQSLQRAREAAYRFIGYSSRPSSPQIHATQEVLARGPLPRYPSLSATQNATASHKTGLEIHTVAINEIGTHALLGGREIFKTVRVEDGTCVEDLNLRTAIRSTPTQASGKTRQTYSIDIADVAWAKGDCGNYVAAATSSGKIILYDLGHAELHAAQLHEHFRQVHKVTFNPHRGNLLLSGSQDGTVRLWDVRDARNQASTVQSKRKYSGQSDGVRDVKWSPTEGVDFAFGTDSGWLQRWDIRNLTAAKVKIPAHTLACNAIDWHPDGKHIASGGSDKVVRVWDFSVSRRQKPGWEIKAPFPVLNARWRPSCESSINADVARRQCTQLATAYDVDHPVIHIWDFRRPAIPFREMAPYPTAPTDLLWHSQDLLWTVGREGVFLQADIQHARKVMDKRNLQSFALSPLGDVNFVVQRRRQRRGPKLHQAQTVASRSTSSLSTSPDSSFLSRSLQDDTLDHSFLSIRPNSSHTRSNSNSKMPYTQGNNFAINLFFEDVMHNRQSMRPEQVAARGRVPYHADYKVFEYLARKYIARTKIPFSGGDTSLQEVTKAFEANERFAYTAGLYRLAQSWKILSFATTKHLEQREDFRNSGKAPNVDQSIARPGKVTALAKRILSSADVDSPASVRPVSLLSQQLSAAAIGSNASTPLAAPVNSFPDPQDEILTLPPLLAQSAKLQDDKIPKLPLHSAPDAQYVDIEQRKPFQLVGMLHELVKHYSGKGDGQTSATLLSLLTSLLPRTHCIPTREVELTATRYIETYNSIGFLSEQILDVFDNQLEAAMLAGLQPLQIEAIFSTYHEQLLAHRLPDVAARLRKLAYPAYPAVYEDYIKDNSVHMTGREGNTSSCSICRLKTSPFEETRTSLFSTCLLCGHTGHAACLRQWLQDEKEVACPLEGCLCECGAV